MSFFNKDILLSNPNFLNGNLQIIACAGAGKTEFVSERIALQIEQKIEFGLLHGNFEWLKLENL